MVTYLPSQKTSKLDEQDLRGTAGEVRTNSKVTFFNGPLNGHLPPISKNIQVRRTRPTRYCWRSKDELKSDVLQWTPKWSLTSHLKKHPS